MTKFFPGIILLTCMLLPAFVSAQNSDVKADVAISLQQDTEVWAGQQVTLNLDLKTSGLSFSNSLFNLPEVNGAFLMQTDTTTIIGYIYHFMWLYKPYMGIIYQCTDIKKA